MLAVVAGQDRLLPEHPGVTLAAATALALVQAMTDLDLVAPLWCVTSGAVAAAPGDRVEHPLQTEVWGLGRAAAVEQPHRWGGLVDLPATVDDATTRRLAAVLAGRRRGPGGRPARRRLGPPARPGPAGRRTSTRRRLVRPAPSWSPAAPARSAATSPAGCSTAAPGRWCWPAAGAPPPPAWRTCSTGTAPTGGSPSPPATSPTGAPWRTWSDSLPGLTAVVHAAGTDQLTPLTDTTLDEFSHVVAGKVLGALHLDACLADRDLGAFVLFSSISGVWGSAGQCAYGAGNSLLDALAVNRRGRGLPATAVSWTAWGGGAAWPPRTWPPNS